MSKERDFRLYVRDHFGPPPNRTDLPPVITKDGVDVAQIAKNLGLQANTLRPDGRYTVPEFEMRSRISQAIGKVEEGVYNTQKTKIGERINEVPEITLEHSTRLADLLYTYLTPIDV